MIMRALILVVGVLLGCTHLGAQTNVWQPSAGHTQVPIWPGIPPDAQPTKGPEFAHTNKNKVAGRLVMLVERVAQPTMTVYPPTGTNTGVAIVVFPGGGYDVLAIDLEGTEVCEWLASRGITGVLLKYRVPGSGPYGDAPERRPAVPAAPAALEDAQRTIGLVRAHAAEWHINPEKVGVMGFSAGGHLAAAVSTHFDRRLYPAADGADREPCRPDFAVILYPAYLLEHAAHDFELNPAITVTGRTPPTFLVHAENDPGAEVPNSLVYYTALKKAEVAAELHIFSQGGHGFGLRPTQFPISDWPGLVERWLGTIGMIRK
jgi:acetyl esterase/lipase